MYLPLRVWCNGSTAAFQASGEGSSPFARKSLFPINEIQLQSNENSAKGENGFVSQKTERQ